MLKKKKKKRLLLRSWYDFKCYLVNLMKNWILCDLIVGFLGFICM